MSDIVERLRAWVYTDSQYATAREAADEIERLNREVSVLVAECQRQKDLLVNGATLTDAEREAVAVAAEAYADDHGERFAATLRSLLERVSFIRDYPEPDNAASEDIASVRKPGGDFGQPSPASSA
jgi:regulator of protease activity HflC (stomatin/prohibitin superfamily)